MNAIVADSVSHFYGAGALKKPKSQANVLHCAVPLAYADKRRRKFARSQLIAAMKILQNGTITTKQLKLLGRRDGAYTIHPDQLSGLCSGRRR